MEREPYRRRVPPLLQKPEGAQLLGRVGVDRDVAQSSA
jgi:hypothetical protein